MRPKTMIAVAATVALVGGVYAWLEYNRKPASTSDLSAEISISAADLLKAFADDELTANVRFNDRVIEVSGTVISSDVGEDGRTEVLLDTGDPLANVSCSFEPGTEPQWRAGTEARVKGICTGMLMDVVLVRCTPVQ